MNDAPTIAAVLDENVDRLEGEVCALRRQIVRLRRLLAELVERSAATG